jgi:hypothetical protein
MPVYILHPNNNDLLEKVEHTHQLLPIEGKFLYFSSIDTLVVADSLDLYHKDIFLHLQSLSFRSSLRLPVRPDGYGRMEQGNISSWKSVFFGETLPAVRQAVEKALAGLAV